MEAYRYLLDHFVLPQFGDIALAKVRADDVRRWHGSLVKTAPKSIPSKAYRLLHAIFATAVEDGLIAANPVRIKGAGAERADERPILGPSHVAAIASVIDPRWRAMILLAAYGALRFGELVGLRRRDVDLLHGLVIVDGQVVELSSGEQLRSPPKSAAGYRKVSLPAFVVDELAHHLDTYVAGDPDSPVFTGERGGVPTRTNWARTWAAAREAAGLPDTVHLHDLRHAGATLAAQVGATTKELMARLGHASARASLIYQHAAEHRDRVIADALDEVARPAHQLPETTDSRAIDARWRNPESKNGDPEDRPHTA
jgi:integrase